MTLGAEGHDVGLNVGEVLREGLLALLRGHVYLQRCVLQRAVVLASQFQALLQTQFGLGVKSEELRVKN